MSGSTNVYIPSSWRFKRATLPLALQLIVLFLVHATASTAQSASNTSGSNEDQPQQQSPQGNKSETESEYKDGNFLQRLASFYKKHIAHLLPQFGVQQAAKSKNMEIHFQALGQQGSGWRRAFRYIRISHISRGLEGGLRSARRGIRGIEPPCSRGGGKSEPVIGEQGWKPKRNLDAAGYS